MTTRPSSQAFPGKNEAKVPSRSRNDRLRARWCTRRYATKRVARSKNLFFLRQESSIFLNCFCSFSFSSSSSSMLIVIFCEWIVLYAHLPRACRHVRGRFAPAKSTRSRRRTNGPRGRVVSLPLDETDFFYLFFVCVYYI